MQIPGNMTTPPLRLDDGETVAQNFSGLRKKGIFGNRYGGLFLTDRRLAFVKAIMRSGIISAVAHARGAKAMLEFERGKIVSAEKVMLKKVSALVVSDGKTTERFLLDEAEIDRLLPELRRR